MSKSVTFVVPAFNESATIKQVLTDLNYHAANLGLDYEILVVDDGSTDDTVAIAQTFFLTTQVDGTVISNRKNRGYGFSLKHGARRAKKSYLFFFDADGQHRSDQVAAIISQMDADSPLIIGKRRAANTSPLWRRPGKSIIRYVAQRITNSELPDLFSGFRLIERRFFLSMQGILPNGFSISTTSTLAAHFLGTEPKWVEIESNRRDGRSTATPMDGLRIALLLVRIVTLFAPLKVFFPISFFVGSLGLFFIAISYADEGVSSIRGLLAILFGLTIGLQGLLVDQISALRRGERVTTSNSSGDFLEAAE